MPQFSSMLRFAASASLASLAVLVFAGVADAGQITLEDGDYWYHGGGSGWSATSLGGGEFRVKAYSGPALAALGANVAITTANTYSASATNADHTKSTFNSLFETFCVEYPEHFSPGATYSFDINTGAINGGFSGQVPVGSNFDPLDPMTAYLYTQFWTGQLASSGYHYVIANASDTGRVASATSLQLAFWKIEGELSGSVLTAYNGDSQAKAWYDQAVIAVAVGGSWYQQWGANSIGNVRVMNLYTGSGATRVNDQDQLVLLEVPLPAASLLGMSLMSGIGIVAALRRRRRQTL